MPKRKKKNEASRAITVGHGTAQKREVKAWAVTFLDVILGSSFRYEIYEDKKQAMASRKQGLSVYEVKRVTITID